MDNIMDKMLIEIYDGNNAECGSGCAACSSSGCDAPNVKEQAETLAADLKKTFGNSVEVRYYDADATGMDEGGYCQQIIDAGYKFPITMINGYPRIAGAINGPLIREQLDQIAFEFIKAINESAAANSGAEPN